MNYSDCDLQCFLEISVNSFEISVKKNKKIEEKLAKKHGF